MPRATVNGIELEYEIDGDGPPLLLVMGLGGQLTDWPREFVDLLAKQFTTVRFDNRDSGRSTLIDAPEPTRGEIIKARFGGGGSGVSYRLDDMAADAAALVRSLDLGSVHVVGMSMGGMIAQLLALDHAPLVRTLCSIMSNTGHPIAGRPTIRTMRHLARQRPSGPADALEQTLDFFELIGGQDWNRAEQRERTAASIERSFRPAGVLRQSLAISASENRTARLAQIGVPTLVVHGLDDTLVLPSGGIKTAERVPDSRLLMFPRMGHDIPATRHREIVDAIVDNAARS